MFRQVEVDQVTGPLKKSYLNHTAKLTLHIHVMKYFFLLINLRPTWKKKAFRLLDQHWEINATLQPKELGVTVCVTVTGRAGPPLTSWPREGRHSMEWNGTLRAAEILRRSVQFSETAQFRRTSFVDRKYRHCKLRMLSVKNDIHSCYRLPRSWADTHSSQKRALWRATFSVPKWILFYSLPFFFVSQCLFLGREVFLLK